MGGHDMGPSWIWQHHVHIQELLKEFGLELFLQYEEGYALYDTKDSLQKFIPPEIIPSARVNGSLSKLIDGLESRLDDVEIVLNEEVVSIVDKGTIITHSQKNSYESEYLISTLPPRLASKIEFEPKLDETLFNKMQQTQTWMGNSAKCVCTFKKAFWKEENLSGFVFSNIGPLGEIHDASTLNEDALFGFVKMNVDTQEFQKELETQLHRVFKDHAKELVDVHTVDWKKEKYTATKEDWTNLSTHPVYGIDTSNYSKKILFSSTEFSYKEGGYLEGAIIQAKKVANILKER